jgi:outer membrane lipoprotein carrier protein
MVPDLAAAILIATGIAATPPDAEVGRAVEKMQAFYEHTKDFEAHFEQTYTYKTFGRKQQSSGRVRFAKPALMRWDYEKPSTKVFVVAKDKAYVLDPEAKTLHVSGISTERLSTSITFLWGQGRLADEFEIRRGSRPDLSGGVQIELTPKKPDPRFQKVFFLLDPKSYAVRTTIVIDPDGSENRMDFSETRVNPGLKAEDFELHPSADVQIIKM